MKRFAALVLALTLFGAPAVALAADYNPAQEKPFDLWQREEHTIG